MNRREFLDWQNHPITKQIFEIFKDREEELKEILALSSGNDPLADRYRAGYIAALRDFYLTDLEDKEDA